MIAKCGNSQLRVPKQIAEEMRKSAGGSQGAAERQLANYDQLTENARAQLAPTEETLTELKEHMKSLYGYATEMSRRESSTQIAESLTELVYDIKGHFESIKEASEQDIHLVASAFERAILSKKDVYIVTEDEHIEHVAEILYNLIVCEQTGITKKLLDKILPMKVYVLSSRGDSKYCTRFNYQDVPVGRHYSLRSLFTPHFGMGTVLGSKAIGNASKDIPAKVREKLQSLNKYLPQAPSVETQSQGVIPAEKAETPAETKLQSTFSIIKEYARKAFENREETPEKDIAISALEELLEFADDVLRGTVSQELSTLQKKEISYQLDQVNAGLDALNAELKKVVSAERWYDNPENFIKYERMNAELKEKITKKRELEDAISDIIS